MSWSCLTVLNNTIILGPDFNVVDALGCFCNQRSDLLALRLQQALLWSVLVSMLVFILSCKISAAVLSAAAMSRGAITYLTNVGIANVSRWARLVWRTRGSLSVDASRHCGCRAR